MGPELRICSSVINWKCLTSGFSPQLYGTFGAEHFKIWATLLASFYKKVEILQFFKSNSFFFVRNVVHGLKMTQRGIPELASDSELERVRSVVVG